MWCSRNSCLSCSQILLIHWIENIMLCCQTIFTLIEGSRATANGIYCIFPWSFPAWNQFAAVHFFTTDMSCCSIWSPAVAAALIIQPNCLVLSPQREHRSIPFSPEVSPPLSPVDSWMYLTHKSFIASAIHPPSCVKHHFVAICIRRVSLQQPPNVLLESFGLVWDCWLLCFMTFKCVGLLSCLEWMFNGS